MKTIIKHIVPLILVILTAVSCNNKECFDNQSTLPLAGLYSMQTGTAITVDSLTVYGIGAPGDSILLNNASDVSSLYMPMPLSGTSTSFVIYFNNKDLDFVQLYDTLKIDYNCYPQFVSNECGAIYKYDITDFSHTTHLIDSVAIPTMEFDNVDKEVIKIYFRTSAE